MVKKTAPVPAAFNFSLISAVFFSLTWDFPVLASSRITVNCGVLAVSFGHFMGWHTDSTLS